MNRRPASESFKLLRIEEDEELASQLGRIFSWVGKLQSLELNQEYAFYPPGLSLLAREDRVILFKERESLLSLAPEIKDGFFVVPRVL